MQQLKALHFAIVVSVCAYKCECVHGCVCVIRFFCMHILNGDL